MANDSLARGAKSAVFPSNSHVADEKWSQAFKDINTNYAKTPKKRLAKKNVRKVV